MLQPRPGSEGVSLSQVTVQAIFRQPVTGPQILDPLAAPAQDVADESGNRIRHRLQHRYGRVSQFLQGGPLMGRAQLEHPADPVNPQAALSDALVTGAAQHQTAHAVAN